MPRANIHTRIEPVSKRPAESPEDAKAKRAARREGTKAELRRLGMTDAEMDAVLKRKSEGQKRKRSH